MDSYNVIKCVYIHSLAEKSGAKNTLIQLLIGGAAGAVIGLISILSVRNSVTEDMSFWERMLPVLLILVSFYAGFLINIILHEAGHLFCGLASGYGFVTFSVGHMMFIKENGRVTRKKYGISGAAGQCLMSPPEPKNGAYPHMLYYLGGSLMNFAVSGFFTAMFFCFRDAFAYAGAVFVPLIVTGAFLGLINILPLRLDGIVTDGYNAVSLGKNEQTQRANWILMTYAARLAAGERAKDMPEEWFSFPDDYDFNVPLQANVAVSGVSRFIDRHEFAEAKALAEKILQNGDKLIGLLKNELHCELLFLNIIGEPGDNRTEAINRLYTDELKQYIRTNKTHLSKYRLMYAYEKLISKDSAKAAEALAAFNKTLPMSPFAGDRESERELIGIIDALP